MAKQFGSGAGSNSAVTDLQKGLKDRSPKWPDASTKMKGYGKGGSVNNDATRSSVAKGPKSLGPREA